MSITARWDNQEQTILILTFKGKWNRDGNVEQAMNMAQAVGHPVYMLMDFRFSGWLLRDLVVLPLHTMPPNITAVIALGLKPLLFYAGIQTIYATSMEEARRNLATLMEHSNLPTSPDETDCTTSETDDSLTHMLLRPFEQVQAINLISFEPNGQPASSSCPFVLYKQHLYLLTTSTSAEFARIQGNPYVKIDPHNPDFGAGQVLALASVAALKYRPHLNNIWEQKYGQKIALFGLHRPVWLELKLLSFG